MKIKVMSLDTQTFTTYECDGFEFRSNNACNWVSIMKDGKEIAFIERVGVIKTIANTHVDRKCSKCVNANNPVVCSWIMKDIAEEKGCDFWQDSSDEPFTSSCNIVYNHTERGDFMPTNTDEITVEEAIKTIQELMKACTPDSKYYKVGNMAINALLRESKDE